MSFIAYINKMNMVKLYYQQKSKREGINYLMASKKESG
jgi:hypothetical protein